MIRKPLPFREALQFLLDKEDLPAEWSASTWAKQESDFLVRAFIISKVENARFLDRAHGLIFDYMAQTTEKVISPDGVDRIALKVAGRENFVKRMRDFMLSEGMAEFEEFKDVNQKDITDIRSLARLRLIFDTNVRQSYGYGQWRQGMEPAVFRAFPAARLIRDMSVNEPRPRHQENLGEVLLKTDPRWAEFHNAKDIGGFGVPWSPYGFNSGCGQEDVPKAEAQKLGLIKDEETATPKPQSINSGLEASVKIMPKDLKDKLLAELRAERKPNKKTPADYAREAAKDTRRIMLERGMNNAIERGDESRAEKYKDALAGLLDVLEITDNGDTISPVSK